MSGPPAKKMSGTPPRTRILQIVGVMNRAGIETWLMNILRSIDQNRFEIDFVVEAEQPGDYDDELRRLGSKIYCVGARKTMSYGLRLNEVLTEHGGYDVIHSHLNHYNGYVMRLASKLGIATRISHSHTDSSDRDRRRSVLGKLSIRLLHHWIHRYSTHGLAASEPAAESQFGHDWRKHRKFRVLHCSVDLLPFSATYDRKKTREEFGLPEDAWVIGHVGRMLDVKNHRFLLNSFAEVAGQIHNAYLLLVGDGPLRQEIEIQAQQLGVLDRVRFAGNRKDVPRILCAAFDLFAMPSKYEGLPLALLEAQAAGLPCVVSNVVAEEADAIPDLVTRRSINESWSPTLMSLLAQARQRERAISKMLQSDFAIENGVKELQRIYAQASRSDRRSSDSVAA